MADLVPKEPMAYWRRGHEIVEARLAKAVKADNMDAPMPLVGKEAKLWHHAQAEAYRDALEMMGVPESMQNAAPEWTLALMAAEFGFKAHERGLNLEAAMAEFRKLANG